MAPVPGVCPKALTARASKHITQIAELRLNEMALIQLSLKTLSQGLALL
jgi:hypothetical protein